MRASGARACFIVLIMAVAELSWGAPADPALTGRAMGILRDNCLSCHNPEKAKGKLVLSTRERALVGGEDGVVLVPGDSGKSRVAGAVLADAETHMPPKGQLTDQEIATLRAWIDGGAGWDVGVLTAPRVAATRAVELRALPASYVPVLAMAISPDQRWLAAGRGDRVMIYDLSRAGRPLVRELRTANDVVQSLAWSADGRWLASGGYRCVHVWESSSWRLARDIRGGRGRVTAMAFLPKEPVLIAADGEVGSPAVVRMWRAPDGELVGEWGAHADSVLAMKVTKDGKFLATGSADKLVKVWDVAARKEVAKLEGHSGPVMAVALSEDGASLASAGSDKEIKVWDVAKREQVIAMTGCPSAVTDLAWVKANTWLSTSEDGVGRLLSEGNKERADRAFSGAADVLYCGAVTGDGKTVFAGCHDGRVYVWSLASGKLEGTLGVTVEAGAATTRAAGVPRK